MVAHQLGGGIGRGRSRLIPAFAEAGVAVDLLLVDATGPFAERARRAARLLPMRSSHPAYGLRDLVRYLRRERPDAVLTDRIRLNRLVHHARAIAGSSARVYTSVHDSYSTVLDALSARKRRSKLRALRRVYPRNDGIIAVSEGVGTDLADLADLPRERVPVVHNPVIPDDTDPAAAERPDHPWLGDGGAPVILFVGRLEAQKDLPTLIDAFARLQARRPSRLLLIGEGGEREAITERVARHGLDDRVAIPGWRDDVHGAMAACDLLVLPSRHEGLPNALIEALAAGAPVVATDCPSGPHEILEGGRYGRLVPVSLHD